jgi:hypothetical protein
LPEELDAFVDEWRVWFSGTVITAVLKYVAKKRLAKTEDLYVSCH